MDLEPEKRCDLSHISGRANTRARYDRGHAAGTVRIFAPLLYAIPIQLLAYHTAVIKGTDVDQPRNLAENV